MYIVSKQPLLDNNEQNIKFHVVRSLDNNWCVIINEEIIKPIEVKEIKIFPNIKKMVEELGFEPA